VIIVNGFDEATARRRLRMLDVPALDEVIAQHAHEPVATRCLLSRAGITYQVVLGEQVLWSTYLQFEDSYRYRPGGIAFREAAHEQDAIAWAILTLSEAHRARGRAEKASAPKPP